jgi:hypothetical protein
MPLEWNENVAFLSGIILGSNKMYTLKPVSVKNRLGESMDVLVHSFATSDDHVCMLVATPKKMHASAFTKNAEYIAHQLRKRCHYQAKGFSIIEIRSEKVNGNNDVKETEESWYDWKFNWVGDTPIDSKCYTLSAQKKSYLENLLSQSKAA